MALAHDLGKLFRSKSLDPDGAIADAVGSDRRTVKKSRFFYHLNQGLAAGISGTKLKWPDVVALLEADDVIRPGMKVWNATLWAFLRGELAPNFGVPELIDHHLARVNFARIANEENFRTRLKACGKDVDLESRHYWFFVMSARTKDIELFTRAPIAVTDKLTLAGLLYIDACLGRDFARAEKLEGLIEGLLTTTALKGALGPVSDGVGVEIRSRLFGGQLLFSYGQRPTNFVRPRSPSDFLVSTEDAQGALDGAIREFNRFKLLLKVKMVEASR